MFQNRCQKFKIRSYEKCRKIDPRHIVWKLLKMSHLKMSILPFSTNFSSFESDLSGNNFWPQASGFQKLAKMKYFWHSWLDFFARNVQWDFFCDFQTSCVCFSLCDFSTTAFGHYLAFRAFSRALVLSREQQYYMTVQGSVLWRTHF